MLDQVQHSTGQIGGEGGSYEAEGSEGKRWNDCGGTATARGCRRERTADSRTKRKASFR